jgi:hypothetical protein
VVVLELAVLLVQADQVVQAEVVEPVVAQAHLDQVEQADQVVQADHLEQVVVLEQVDLAVLLEQVDLAFQFLELQGIW